MSTHTTGNSYSLFSNKHLISPGQHMPLTTSTDLQKYIVHKITCRMQQIHKRSSVIRKLDINGGFNHCSCFNDLLYNFLLKANCTLKVKTVFKKA